MSFTNVTNILVTNFGWENGSVIKHFNETLSQADQNRNNLNISLYNNNFTTLSFDSGKSNFSHWSNTIRLWTDEDNFTFPVLCAFAISGQYGFLCRLLYYMLLLISLVIRRHIWLSTAALGTALTYSATAAVHCFAILTRFHFQTVENVSGSDVNGGGEADLFAIFPIVVVGACIVTPILNWSITVRENEARPVVVYWGMMMFAASIAILVKFWLPQFNAFPVLFNSFALCSRTADDTCNFESIRQNPLLRISQQFYQKCSCVDYCGSISTEWPFRSNQNMNAWLISDKTVELSLTPSLTTWNTVIAIFLCIVFVQGIMGLVESRFTQAQVRNWVFRKLTSSQLHDRFFNKIRATQDPTSKDTPWIIRAYKAVAKVAAFPFAAMDRFFYDQVSERPNLHSGYSSFKTFMKDFLFWVAKLVATAIYITSLLLAIIAPLVCVGSVAVNEINVHQFPVSEQSDAVGQWSAIVSAALVLIAAFIVRYNPPFWHAIGRYYAHVVRFVRYVRGKGPLHRDTDRYNEKDNTKNDIRKILGEMSRPFIHAWHSTLHGFERTVREFRDFFEWWGDPVYHSVWDWEGVEESWWVEHTQNGDLFQSWDSPADAMAHFQGPYPSVYNHRKSAGHKNSDLSQIASKSGVRTSAKPVSHSNSTVGTLDESAGHIHETLSLMRTNSASPVSPTSGDPPHDKHPSKVASQYIPQKETYTPSPSYEMSSLPTRQTLPHSPPRVSAQPSAAQQAYTPPAQRIPPAQPPAGQAHPDEIALPTSPTTVLPHETSRPSREGAFSPPVSIYNTQPAFQGRRRNSSSASDRGRFT